MLPQLMLKVGEGPPAGGQQGAGGHQDVATPCPHAANEVESLVNSAALLGGGQGASIVFIIKGIRNDPENYGPGRIATEPDKLLEGAGRGD